jgi:hypothetical protein
MRTNLSCFAVAIACGGLFACGSSSSSGGAPGTGNSDDGGDAGGPTTVPVVDDAGEAADADAGPPVDHGAPSSMYPAFTPDVGQIVDNNGYVMKSPVIVAITWNSDKSQAQLESFADTIGQTSYWQATTSEYGVGPAKSGTTNHVQLSTAAPATVTDAQLQQMVTTNATGAKGAWPAPTEDTIYAFFLPPGTSLTLPGQSGSSGDACSQGVGGYHDQVTVGSTITSYAVVPSCTFPGVSNTAEQQSTESMSHELIEAVTDPQPQQQMNGYVGFDNDHLSFDWFQSFQSEVGDACEVFATSMYEDQETTPVAFDNWVQRTWSNKSVAAGHNPCVPLESKPYFNVTPLALQEVSATLSTQLTGGTTAQKIMSKGVYVAAGQSATFPVGFYSDAATSGPWTLSFSYGSAFASKKPTYLSATTDKVTGQNGEKAYITVKVNSLGTGAITGAELLVIKSTLDGESHVMPVLISSEM